MIDEIVPEPAGGAHRDHEAAAANLHQALTRNLAQLRGIPAEELIEQRYQKFRKMSRFTE